MNFMIEHEKFSVNEIFTHSPLLCEIVKKVNQLSKLNRAVQQKLDPELANQCRIANYRDNILILTTPSQAVGHKLRFAASDLLTTLRTEPDWCGLRSIKIQVRPKLMTTVTPPIPNPIRPSLSAHNAEILKSTATTIPFMPLQHALLRLSNRQFVKTHTEFPFSQ